MNLIIENMNYLELSATIRQERRKQKLNQQDFAEKCGVHKNTISSIENFRSVKDESLKKVADYLGFELEIEYKLTSKYSDL